MDPIIARDFSFSRDFRSIDWGATLKHNLLRAVCAGMVWAGIGLFTGPPHFVDPPLLLPLIFPLGFLCVLLPLGLICAFLAKFIPFIGLLSVVIAILVVVGDPIVCILSLIVPGLVPMHKPGFFMFSLIIWLLKTEEGMDVPIADQRAGNR